MREPINLESFGSLVCGYSIANAYLYTAVLLRVINVILTEMPVVGEHIAVQDWPIDAESDLKDGSILVKVRLRRKANPVL